MNLSKLWGGLAIAVLLVGAVVVVSNQSKPTPTPATTTTTTVTPPTTPSPATTTTETTTSAPTTTIPPATVYADVCAQLDHATTGDTIDVAVDAPGSPDGALQLGGCDAHPKGRDVTVTGGWSGDVKCHVCSGWRFDHVTVRAGSLKMIGGAGWTIDGGTFDGGKRGGNYVIGVGATDETDSGDDQPHDFTISGVSVAGAGCSPGGDNWSHALYVNGKNGVSMHGLVIGSTFTGEGCAATVKIGGTGSNGVGKYVPDSADDVTFTGNTVTNTGTGDQSQAVLVAADSDFVTIADSTLTSGKFGINASGPFTGTNLLVRSNRVTAPRFLLVKVWVIPGSSSTFVNYVTPGPCPQAGTCVGNS